MRWIAGCPEMLERYDGKNPIGFAVLLKDKECRYIYFLAIGCCIPAKGYGSMTIQKLLEVYSDLQFVLDFEVIDKNAENNAQRIRRKKFYL